MLTKKEKSSPNKIRLIAEQFGICTSQKILIRLLQRESIKKIYCLIKRGNFMIAIKSFTKDLEGEVNLCWGIVGSHKKKRPSQEGLFPYSLGASSSAGGRGAVTASIPATLMPSAMMFSWEFAIIPSFNLRTSL